MTYDYARCILPQSVFSFLRLCKSRSEAVRVAPCCRRVFNEVLGKRQSTMGEKVYREAKVCRYFVKHRVLLLLLTERFYTASVPQVSLDIRDLGPRLDYLKRDTMRMRENLMRGKATIADPLEDEEDDDMLWMTSGQLLLWLLCSLHALWIGHR